MAALAYAALSSARLVSTLHSMGWEDARVERTAEGYFLFIGDAGIAGGISSNPVEAMDNLLDRAANLFFFETPEA